jgi:F-type H+-transporting ATPase subunit gamma
MEELTRLRSRIDSISELLSVVHTMRALSAVRMRQANESLAGSREYAEVIGVAFADALALLEPEWQLPRPQGRGGHGLLVFCSEHGFVGALNEVLIDHASAALDGGKLFMVGTRGTLVASERGIEVSWQLPMTTRRDGIPVVARKIAAELYRRFEREEIDALDLVFARTSGVGSWTIEQQSLLPLDPEAFPVSQPNIPPLHYLPAGQLVERLAEEYFFAELTHGAMEALAGENTARVAAMGAAHDNIERKLDELRHAEANLRQEGITTELIDVITGSEALLHPKL